MDYTCFVEIPRLMEERSSTQLLEFSQQQQQNQNYNFYNPQHFNFPADSWSTTDPTLLLIDQQQQQRPQFLFNGSSSSSLKVSCDHDSARDDDMESEASCCGLSSFPAVHCTRSSTDLHHHAQLSNIIAAATAEHMNLRAERLNPRAELMNLDDDIATMSGRSNCHRNALSNNSTMDPFSFSVAAGGDGGGDGVNASSTSQSQWMQQMCSLPSDQYHSCVDALMMPKLVSDIPFADSPQQQPQQQPSSYYTPSTSVNCFREADSCGSSDRDRSTTLEEINWMNNSGSNNSDLSNLPNLRGCVGGCDSVTGLITLSSSSSAPVVELPDEFSSSLAAAAADEIELGATPLDPVRHHHRSTSTVVECGAVAVPSGRVSWMSPGIGGVQKNNYVTSTTTTLDPLLLLGSGGVAPTQQQINNGLLPAPRSLGPFKPQHQAYTLDSLPPTRALPFSLSASQNRSRSSSSISPRYSSVYSMPPLNSPGLMENCTTSGSSFYKDLHSFSSRPQQHGVAATTSSSVPPAGGVGVKEFNMGGGLEPRRNYCSDQMTLLSASRKPSATSIEPQSVAARHRRKKISERVRILEKLIPGGNKMDTASMLDEAIDYVKFLQLQVQLLESMGEPETLNTHSGSPAATEGGRGSNSIATTTSSTTLTMNSSPFHPHENSKVDSSALIGSGLGSSHHLSRSSALMQQVTIAAAVTTKSTSTPPLILSEVLQEQLFKQKLCLVSLRQYCPQQQARGSC